MRFGFVKVAAATPSLRVADVAYNAEKIAEAIGEADKAGVQLLVFPELSLSGYTCGDLFGQQSLLDGCAEALRALAERTAGIGMLVFVGVPVRLGGALYNCAAALNGGKVIAFVPKTYLPNYAEFYERRNFRPYTGENTSVGFYGAQVPFGNKFVFAEGQTPDFTVAAELCEDLWAAIPPSSFHAQAGANIIVNLSASDETAGKAEYRRLLVRAQSAKCVCGYVYADAGEGESTTDMVFSGHDIIAENGEIVKESALFQTGLTVSEIDAEKLAGERRRINTFGDGQLPAGYAAVPFAAYREDGALTRAVPKLPFLPQAGGCGAAALPAFSVPAVPAPARRCAPVP